MHLAFADLDAVDDTPAVQALFSRLESSLPDQKLLDECSGDWGYDDPVYRFYDQSFKVRSGILPSGSFRLYGHWRRSGS